MNRFENTTFLLGDWTVDSARNELRRGEEVHTLRPGLMSVLVFLAQNAQETVSNQDIIDGPWNGISVAESSVYRAISDLRKLLGDSDQARSYIKTVPRRGYCLIAHVEIVARSEEGGPPHSPPQDQVPLGGEPPEPFSIDTSPTPGAWVRAHRLLLGGLFAAILLTLALLAFLAPRPDFHPDGTETLSIAVLPLTNLTDDPRQDYLTDGLSSELINRLAQNPKLRVLARQSSFAYRGPDFDLDKIAADLDVDTVLAGTVRRLGNTLKISAQLINTESGYSIWSQTFETPLDDLQMLQDKMSEEIALAVRPYLGGEDVREPEARRTSLKVYDAYLLGQHYLTQGSKSALIKSLAYFDSAITLDPDFAPAYVGKANGYLMLSESNYGPIPEDDAIYGASVLIEKALDLDPNLAAASVTRGKLKLRALDLTSASAAFDQAIAHDPSSAEAYHWRAQVALSHLDIAAATRALSRAHELDPHDLTVFTRLVDCLILGGNYDKAEELIARYQQVVPDAPSTIATARLETARGNLARAYQAAEEAARANDHDVYRRQLAIALLNLGEVERAKATAPATSPPYVIEDVTSPLISRLYLDLPGTTIGNENIWMNSALTEFLKGENTNASNYFELATRGNTALEGPLFSLFPEETRAPFLAYAWKHAGNHGRAVLLIRTINEALTHYEEAGDYPGARLLDARLAILEEDPKRALASLTRLDDMGALSWTVLREPIFENLKRDPDFIALTESAEARVNAERGELGWEPIQIFTP